MKKGVVSLAFTLLVGLAATASEPVNEEKKVVNTETSKVTWKAYKVTGSHYGSIALKEGALMFDGDQLSGGEFVVDMTTISTEDLEGDSKGKLDGHLNSPDFFDTANHTEASLKFTGIETTGKNSYKVTGDLTIKGIKKAVTFDLSVYGSKATATLKVDRAKYNVKYGSGSFFDNLGDKTIYDEFDLVVDLEF